MGYKLKNGSAAKMMAASPLFETEGVDYGTDAAGRKYYYSHQVKNMMKKTNALKPGDADYDKYERDESGKVKYNKFGHAQTVEGAYDGESTVTGIKGGRYKGQGGSNLSITKGHGVDLSGTSGGHIGSSSNQGGGGKQDNKISVDGPKSDSVGVATTGDGGKPSGSGMSIKQDEKPASANNPKKEVKKPKPENNNKSNNNKPKVSYSEAYKNRDMKTYGGLNEADYTKEAKRQNEIYKKTGKWDTPKAPMTSEKPEMEKKEEQPTSTTNTAPKSKMETTVTNAMDPNSKLINKSTEYGGRVGRVKRRQERRTARVTERNQRRRGEIPTRKEKRQENREQIKTIRLDNRNTRQESKESAKQERKNLLTDNPVDKDATGGRYKNDKSTKKLVKEASKTAKSENAMNRAKKAIEDGDKKALRKSGVKGKFKRAGKKDIKAANKANKETPKQEKKNLLKDNPVDKDATGGRASSGTFDYSQSTRKNRKRYA